MKEKGRRAVFLDRDGTINVEVGYLSRPEEFALIPGSAEAIRRLNGAGFLVVVVSNQSGVARGYFGEEDVRRVNERMVDELERHGAYLDAIYYCPHHPEVGDDSYRWDCDCRKPKSGMIALAERDLGIDPAGSFVVGDHRGDILLAHNVRAISILVLSGHGTEELEKLKEEGSAPDFVAGDLAAAVDYILAANEKKET